MTDSHDWFHEYDTHKDQFAWFMLVFGFEDEWAQVQALRKRRQRKRMVDVMRQTFNDMPEEFTTITDENNPIGLANFINLIK